jgi:tetratricopeptide (TPR) repeat protein
VPVPTVIAMQRAHALAELGRWEESIEALRPALADPGSGSTPWCLLARCQLGLSRAGDAERSARRAIGIDPHREWAHRLLALALARRRRNRAAVRACRAALRISPDLAEGLHLLTALRIAQGHRREATWIALRNLEVNPHHPLALQSAAAAALARRRWADAERHARQGLSLAPDDADLALQLGRALQKQGRRGESGEAYAAAGRAAPTDHRPREALGRMGGPAWYIALVAQTVALYQLIGMLRYEPAPLAQSLAIVLGGFYLLTELLYLRVRRGLNPHLRVVAARQRKMEARIWLGTTALASGTIAVRAFWGGYPVTGLVLVAVLVTAVAVRRRLPKAPPGSLLPPRLRGTPAAQALQRMRRRFR